MFIYIIFLSITIFIIYLNLITKDDIKNISIVNPVNGHISYGFFIYNYKYKRIFKYYLNYIFFVIINILLLVIIYLKYFKDKLIKDNLDNRNIFVLGCGIFIFTFLI